MKLALAALALCLFETVAHADEERYPLRIIAADAVSTGVFVAGIAVTADRIELDSTRLSTAGVVLVLVGALSYAATPALLHAERRNGGGAMRSVAARLGLPLALGFGGFIATRSEDTAGYLALAGAASAMVLDWAVLAKARLVVAPVDGGAQLGFAGTF